MRRGSVELPAGAAVRRNLKIGRDTTLQIQEEDVPTLGIMRLVEQGGAFDFWLQEGEAIYTPEDGEPV